MCPAVLGTSWGSVGICSQLLTVEHFSAQSQRGSWVHAEGVGCLSSRCAASSSRTLADVEVSTDVSWCSPCLSFIGQPLQPTWGDPGLP